MAEFISFDNKVEINGQTVLAVLYGTDCFRDKCIEILAKHGISNIQKEDWFSQQSWLNACKEIYKKLGPYEIFCIGSKVPDNAIFPKGIDSLEKAFQSIDIAYHMNHRGGYIGHYNYLQSEDGSMSFVCNNPYPCEFDRGIIDGIAKKFIKKDQLLHVRHDDNASCRTKGDESCTYKIEIKNKS